MKKIIFFILTLLLVCPTVSAQATDYSDTLFFYDNNKYLYVKNNEVLIVPDYFMELGNGLSYGNALLESYNKTKESAVSKPADVSIYRNNILTLNPSDKYLLRITSEQKYYIVEDQKIITEVNPINYPNSKLVIIPDVYFSNYTFRAQSITWDRSLYQFNFSNIITTQTVNTIQMNFSSNLDGTCQIIYRQNFKDNSESSTCTKNGLNYSAELTGLKPKTQYYLTISCNTAGINIPIMYFINVVETKSAPAPSCNESWSCGEWSDCLNNSYTRICSDLNNCGTTKSKPATSLGCMSGSISSCNESWSCGNWSTCSNDAQTRSCNDANSCGTTNSKPGLSQICETIQNNNNNAYTNANSIEIKNDTIYPQLNGKIILKVESVGEAYYIHPTYKKMYYLGRPDDAFAVMREQGVGITNENLGKIPIGLGNLTGIDSDGDGLPDLFEDAIGTDKNNQDTDGDGFKDKAELEGKHNPNGTGGLNINSSFSNGQKGKIFLQVQRNGEAWYINPSDGKRYFLGRPTNAFQVMRELGLGISNNDFNSLSE